MAFHIVSTREVTDEIIADAFTDVIEGGLLYASWIHGVYLDYPSNTAKKPWYADPSIYNQTLLDIKLIERNYHVLHNHKITRTTIANGLRIMASTHPKIFNDFATQEGDVITAINFLQYVLFGEVKYA